MSQKLFVYGVLMSPEILKALKVDYSNLRPATLLGYESFAVSGKAYPAIVKSPEENQVDGMILEVSNKKSLEILDVFEGAEYKRQRVIAKTTARDCEAEAYVWTKNKNMLSGSWDSKKFFKEDLPLYIERLS